MAVTPNYTYSEFKLKLCSTPAWIIRGLTVLAHSPDIATPTGINEIEHYIRVIANNNRRVCPAGVDITETRPSIIVQKHAYPIYKFYLKQFKAPETTS